MTLSVELAHEFPGFALDVRFDAPPGITVLFGRSGSGKTTITNAVAGLLQPRHGRIRVGERLLLDTAERVSLPPHRRQLGTIFQEGRLFPHLTVRQNLGYGRWFADRKAQATHGRSSESPVADTSEAQIVEMLGIGHLMERRPASLSGGEKQRVAIGRALLARPSVILADEPLASLDEARKAEILPCFERLRDEVSIPILYVTHAPAEVARLATTIVTLEHGKVARQGPAMDVLGDPMVMPAGVRAVGALLEATVAAHHADGLSELNAGGISLFLPRVSHPVGSRIRVRIAAQEVLISRDEPSRLSALNILPGTIEAIRAGEGPGAMASIRTPAGLVLARVTRRSAQALGLEEGVTCHAIVKAVAVAPQDVGGGR